MTMNLSERVALCDGLLWLRSHEDGGAGMVYVDPPFGHGTFGPVDAQWIADVVREGLRVARPDGIVYLHCDPILYHTMAPLLPAPRGVIAWKNGWVSGFKSRSTRFWPRQYQLIAGWARDDWRWRRVERPKPDGYERRGGGGGTGFVVSDWWDDIQPVDQVSFSKEKVGWPTQKPLALMERLITGSTDVDDIVMDPTCGSGTTLVAAERTGREGWGADVSPLAVQLAANRLEEL